MLEEVSSKHRSRKHELTDPACVYTMHVFWAMVEDVTEHSLIKSRVSRLSVAFSD